MRKVFLDDLPRGGKCIAKDRINWKKSIGYKVRFIYDDIEGEIEILGYNKNRLILKYKNYITYDVYTGSFADGALGNILRIRGKDYKYKINDVINKKTGEIKILERVKMKNEGNRKGYKYLCLTCGNIDTISEAHLVNENSGCNVCGYISRKILIGVNDLWTTNPEIAQSLKNKQRGYEISRCSTSKENFICHDCGEEYNKTVYSVTTRGGINCPFCGDGVSIPEKIMRSVLNQMSCDFQTQLNKTTLKWCKNYKYDFYIPSLNCIIETHGAQHYKEGFKAFKGGRTLEQEQENDRLKEKLARKNGIKHYIVIDCRKSELDFIKNNILCSQLNEILPLYNVNWADCGKYAYGNLVKEACELWNSGNKSAPKISEILQIHHCTAIEYLKKGTEIGWCDYTSNKMKVICLNTNEVFDSIREASLKYNIFPSSISSCCHGRQKTAGVNESNKRGLLWLHYDEYLKLNQDEIQAKLNDIDSFFNSRPMKVICLNTKEIFESSSEAERIYNITCIASCCKNKYRYAGKLSNGTYLQWQYYYEYKKHPKKLLSNKEIDNLIKGKNNTNSKKVVCLNTDEVFDCINDASIKHQTASGNIIKCCKNERKYSGIKLKTGEKLVWMYYKDYIDSSEKDRQNKIKQAQIPKIVCMNNNILFKNSMEAIQWNNLKRKESVIRCCKGERQSAGKHPITGEKLKWMYYEDYVNTYGEDKAKELKLITQ